MSSEQLAVELRKRFTGEVRTDSVYRREYSRDASIFEITPALVAFPRSADDVAAAVRFAHDMKTAGEDVSVAARAAGTDMSGGSLTPSIALVFIRHLNRIGEIGGDFARVEMGAYYRDFERETLKRGLILPSYPASRGIAAMGGIVNNDSGGERTLRYGQTHRYVEELSVILSDGSRTVFKALPPHELEAKKKQSDFEGEIYRRMHALVFEYAETIARNEPRTSKNASGYALWRVADQARGTFNLAQLIVGAQGTLALVTEAKLRLVKPEPHRAMLIIFLDGLEKAPALVRRVLTFGPESFESYDDHTFKLAIRFLPDIMRGLGFSKSIRLGLSFLPEVWMAARGGVPKLILTAEFAEGTAAAAQAKASAAAAALAEFKLPLKVARDERESEKYWLMRRESFNLLRKDLRGYTAAPFIDDFVVSPDDLPRFLPELNALLAEYRLIYTVAGHIGNGNFHIIPLMKLGDPRSREVIFELSEKVYGLVAKYHGSITGEHNDGIIRTPYLSLMFDKEMLALFAETKKIFDPLNILNPGKKVGGTRKDIVHYLRGAAPAAPDIRNGVI